MKFNHPVLLQFIGWAGAGTLRAWVHTINVRVHSELPEADPRTATQGYLYCLWHETLLLPAAVFADRGIHLLISQHNDGEYITRIVEQLGFKVVRGSTTRGAVRAVRELARSAESANLAITPDGPKGPRQVLQNGALYLASRTGLAIVPMGLAFERPWRASSWDRFVLPRPFTRAACVFASPMSVPRDADAVELEHHHRLVSDAMERAASDAERLLAGRLSGRRRSRVDAGRLSAGPMAKRPASASERAASEPRSEA
jgi:lysophospholipid acyltransferase (LPLAT)-like uncharacterized protein